jgi:D-alanyl-D-alanine carboxypeptidase/D-alanyl-D-alanine-endopeptidase (penicillin-binding protein 4)
MVLASYQGTTPLPAASLTKIATTLAVLESFGPEHTFVTTVEAIGSLNAGVLSGDLIIRGGQDPFFVWEDAIALGNLLNQLGIRTVTGRLLIQGSFYMNFQTDPEISGNLLKSGMNASQWPQAALAQFQTLPAGTPRPQVLVQGLVEVLDPEVDPGDPVLIYQYHSLPIIDLLKKMNRFSNNTMAEMLVKAVGGVNKVIEKVIFATGIPKAEIQLINGSGLGTENRLSPRAATVLFQAIQEKLDPKGLTVADAFEIVGVDTGVLEKRVLPPRLIAKSGTLNQVSSLAGVLSTQQKGSVWFAIMNGTSDLQGARLEQGSLLNSLAAQWQVTPTLPESLAPNYVLDSTRTIKQLQR